MNKLFIDIETLPGDESCLTRLEYLFKRRQEKRKRQKESGKLSEAVEEDFEQFLLSTSFDGSFGRILCIGYALNNDPVQDLVGSEEEMLRKFWEMARNAQLFVGHNIMDFDLRFIYQRSIICNVRPSIDLNFARYRSAPIFDTMREWSKWSRDNFSLEHVSLALGIPTPKKGLDGSQVFEYFKAGKIDEIVAYCKRDVEVTRAVYKRMTFQE